MDRHRASQAADILLDARKDGRQIDDLPPTLRPTSTDEAYGIQDEFVRMTGDRAIGWKVGSTSRHSQKRLGTTEPFAGRILARGMYRSPAAIEAGLSFLRAVQVEFAVRLTRDLADPPIDIKAAIKSVEAVIPTLEIADSRYVDWTRVHAWSLIADNAKDGLIVFGEPLANPGDLAAASVELLVNGIPRASGSGADVLGHPLNALIWLCRDRLRRGDRLRAGEIVSTGTCTGSVYCRPGDRVTAVFNGNAEVTVKFLGD